ncbi:MAG: pyrrolo-quinoline quinone, partial [Planctomycetota bacterium]
SESGYTVSEGWSLNDDGYMSTPVVIDGIAYEHLRSQRLMAVDLKTGNKLWESDQRFGKYWSIISNGDRMLALDQNGSLLLLGASREKFNLIDQRKVSDAETWAHVAAADDQIFIRDLKGLSAWIWKTP